jgi:ketosteroid isomerase-like protein
MTNEQITEALERIGTALSNGDARAVADAYEVPALVLSDTDARPVNGRDEVEAFFKDSVKWYNERGLMSTRPEVEHIEHLSEKLAAVDVRWPGFDADGKEQTSEGSHYIMQLGADGRARIRVALTMANTLPLDPAMTHEREEFEG